MGDFVNRVSHYPVVAESCKVATDAYQWVKGKETLSALFTKLETAAGTLASMVKPVVDSNIAQKLDDVACRQLLDRFESVCPTLKDASTEQIFGPVANRALTLAETCADYCLPEDPTTGVASGDASRLERLSHIRNRATNQALVLFHSCTERAQGLLNGLASSTSNLTQNLSATSLANTLGQVYSLLNFATSTAKAVSLPLVVQGLTTVKDQTEKLNNQVKESGKLSWFDLKNLIDGLDKLKVFLDEQLKKDEPSEIEMQRLPDRQRESQSPNQPTENTPSERTTKKDNSSTEAVTGSSA